MDPLQPRRAGTRRLRLATAAIAGGALVGTGALTVVVAQAHPASATDTATGGATSGSSSDPSSEQGPGRPGGFGHGSGGAHGSSGAS